MSAPQAGVLGGGRTGRPPWGCGVTAVARPQSARERPGARREDTREERNPPGAGVWAGTGPGPSRSPREADELRQRQLPLPLSPARRSEDGPFKIHVNKALFPRPPPLAPLGPLLPPPARSVSGPLTLPRLYAVPTALRILQPLPRPPGPTQPGGATPRALRDEPPARRRSGDGGGGGGPAEVRAGGEGGRRGA